MRRAASQLREEGKTNKGRSDWSRKLFGKSPWHREASGGSGASMASSVSSSVRDVLRGRTPVTSPVSDIGAFVLCRVYRFTSSCSVLISRHVLSYVRARELTLKKER